MLSISLAPALRRDEPLNDRLTVPAASSQDTSLRQCETPMRYTLGQAAKATGTSKMTIQRALKAGRISGEKDETGAYSLDPAEVHRVFPLVTERDRLSDVSVGRNETPLPAVELQLAHAKLEAE